MEYQTHTGGYAEALRDLLDGGGQFYPGRAPGSPQTIVRGNVCSTYWEDGSKIRQNLANAAKELGYQPDDLTPGRLARRVLRDIVGLEHKDTYYGKASKTLCDSGHHWHYTHVETGYHKYLYEFDLKSAYFTSLFHGKSLLLDERKGFLDDRGALENLRMLTPTIPKWLRLIILGTLASSKQQFYTRGSGAKGEPIIKVNQVNKIAYGAAFNAAHKAVFRTYKAMERCHILGGEWIKRIHTDSLALHIDTPTHIRDSVFNFLETAGYQVAIKAQGSSHFLNLNEGIIGKKVVGTKFHVFEQLRQENITVRQYMFDPEEWSLHSQMLTKETAPPAVEAERKPESFYQMNLPGFG